MRLTRRNFGLSLAAAPLLTESALAQLSMVGGSIPADAVLINANENPLGPCAEALDAMHQVIRDGGRYRYQEAYRLAETIAEAEGVSVDSVRAFAGSSDLWQRTSAQTTASKLSFSKGMSSTDAW